MAGKAKIGVLGASGYTGSECVRLLLCHPRVEIAALTADRRAGQEMREVFPQFSPFDLPKLVSIEALDWPREKFDLVFCALPHATTQKVVKDLLARRRRPRWSICRPISGCTPDGLCALVRPRAPRAGTAEGSGLRSGRSLPREIKKARLVANPGCYTTCAQLPLIPLLQEPRRSIPTRSSSMPSPA